MTKKQKHVPRKKSAHKTAAIDAGTISFDSLEFAHHSKNELWYLGIGVLAVVGLYLALRSKDYLLAVLVLAAGLAIYRVSHLKPESKKIVISSRGVYWGDAFFGYHQIKAFWLSEAAGQYTVYLERPNFAATPHFQVPENKLESVLTALSIMLPYHAHKAEPLSDRLARLMRL